MLRDSFIARILYQNFIAVSGPIIAYTKWESALIFLNRSAEHLSVSDYFYFAQNAMLF